MASGVCQLQKVEKQTVRMSTSDLILIQLKEVGKRMDRIENRMDKLEEKFENTRREFNARMDKLNERMDKQDDKIDRLANKIDELRSDLHVNSNHRQIFTITNIGIAIAVIYSLLR